MIYAVAVIIALLLGGGVWLYIQGRASGMNKHEVNARRKAAVNRQAGDAIMSEPIADEDDWLASGRSRIPRVPDDDSG